MNERPPGSSRCPHKVYRTKKINAHTTQLICISCGVLAGWWIDSYSTTGKYSKFTEEEKELMK